MSTTKPDALQRLSTAYAASPDPRRTRAARIAATHEQDDRSERLLELKRRDPAAFGRLPASTRLSLAMYANAREVAYEERLKGRGDA